MAAEIGRPALPWRGPDGEPCMAEGYLPFWGDDVIHAPGLMQSMGVVDPQAVLAVCDPMRPRRI